MFTFLLAGGIGGRRARRVLLGHRLLFLLHSVVGVVGEHGTDGFLRLAEACCCVLLGQRFLGEPGCRVLDGREVLDPFELVLEVRLVLVLLHLLLL